MLSDSADTIVDGMVREEDRFFDSLRWKPVGNVSDEQGQPTHRAA